MYVWYKQENVKGKSDTTRVEHESSPKRTQNTEILLDDFLFKKVLFLKTIDLIIPAN